MGIYIPNMEAKDFYEMCKEHNLDFIAIPADDVRPVVRGKWTDHRTIEHYGEWYCSNCGNEVTICMCGKDKTPDYPFCPNCGAKMTEEEAENSWNRRA